MSDLLSIYLMRYLSTTIPSFSALATIPHASHT
jgi:hypothetical protein